MGLEYTDKVKDHFANPRNSGDIADADGIGEVGNPTCGDIIKIYIKVTDRKIVDIKFQTLGCVAAVAASSAITELAQGKSIERASQITNQQVADYLGGLPKQKISCSNFAADALKEAIVDLDK
ncbi:iron-sulfur cluster assembly scaffold protein [Patescibacteria group bacterium]